MAISLFKGALALCVVFAVIVFVAADAFVANIPFSTGTITANFNGAFSVGAADVNVLGFCWFNLEDFTR